ncbi:MAG: hypothetical protein WCR59_11925, partial [Planctomycetota bacterium]
QTSDQVVRQRAWGLQAGELAIDLFHFVEADHDREAAAAAFFAKVDVLVVTLLLDDDARKFNFDEVHYQAIEPRRYTKQFRDAEPSI